MRRAPDLGPAKCCDPPPADDCFDRYSVLRFDKPGVCNEDGSCSWEPTVVPCDEVCVDGQCVRDPCDFVVCDAPPKSYCSDGVTAVSYATTGWCDRNQQCNYATTTELCGRGCQDGACNPDPCTSDSDCDFPTPACVDSTSWQLLHWDWGQCRDGNCHFSHVEAPPEVIPCNLGETCSGGGCKTSNLDPATAASLTLPVTKLTQSTCYAPASMAAPRCPVASGAVRSLYYSFSIGSGGNYKFTADIPLSTRRISLSSGSWSICVDGTGNNPVAVPAGTVLLVLEDEGDYCSSFTLTIAGPL